MGHGAWGRREGEKKRRRKGGMKRGSAENKDETGHPEGAKRPRELVINKDYLRFRSLWNLRDPSVVALLRDDNGF
jgi:hypothetical protein